MALKADDIIAGMKIWSRNYSMPTSQSDNTMYWPSEAFVEEGLY
jgi:hypothetical protein